MGDRNDKKNLVGKETTWKKVIKLNSLEIGYKDMGPIQIVQDRMASSCEHDNEPSGSVEGRVFKHH
jgi:xanthine dehydrogenase molybdopterin-binding subunit B